MQPAESGTIEFPISVDLPTNPTAQGLPDRRFTLNGYWIPRIVRALNTGGPVSPRQNPAPGLFGADREITGKLTDSPDRASIPSVSSDIEDGSRGDATAAGHPSVEEP